MRKFPILLLKRACVPVVPNAAFKQLMSTAR